MKTWLELPIIIHCIGDLIMPTQGKKGQLRERNNHVMLARLEELYEVYSCHQSHVTQWISRVFVLV